jgi:hypothetical protein
MGSPIPGPEALHWEADGADNRKNGAFSSRHDTMTSDPAALAARLASILESSANADGGWAYLPGKSSRLEPTCWALLALLDGGAAPANGVRVGGGLARLAAWQRADGLLADTPAAPPNLASNGLAAVAIHRMLAAAPARALAYSDLPRRLLAGTLAIGGMRASSSTLVRQDGQLVGWPWNDGTFSWLEPTSWCLLALKKTTQARSSVEVTRISDAERLLADRCCASGGWNFGNANALGRELSAYVPTTALALLALRDRRELPEVTRSLAWLAGHWTREVSAMASSLALVAMRLYGRPADDLERALCDRIVNAGPPDNLASTALVLYALTGPRHEHAALAV